MKYFIDTNIFLRTLIKENKQVFEDCRRFLEAVKFNKIQAATSHIVLIEVAWTLSSYYKFSKKKVIQALKGIVNLRGLELVDDYDINFTLKTYEEKQVKFIDALIFSNPKLKEKVWTVVTYDKDFDKLAILRKEPGEVTS